MNAPRDAGKPQPGFYKIKLTKGGVFVPARLIHQPGRDPVDGSLLDRSYWWTAIIDGDQVAEPSINPIEAGVFRIWPICWEIDEREYDYMLANAEWTRAHAPHEPAANPRQAVDIRQLDPVF